MFGLKGNLGICLKYKINKLKLTAQKEKNPVLPWLTSRAKTDTGNTREGLPWLLKVRPTFSSTPCAPQLPATYMNLSMVEISG